MKIRQEKSASFFFLLISKRKTIFRNWELRQNNEKENLQFFLDDAILARSQISNGQMGQFKFGKSVSDKGVAIAASRDCAIACIACDRIERS